MIKVLNYMMTTRYRVCGYMESEGLAALRAIGLTKQCSRRFAEIARAEVGGTSCADVHRRNNER